MERTSGSSLVEILDHVLDKGIVIDAWVAVSVIGIELVTIEARVVVASVETYVKYAQLLGAIGPIAGGLREPTQRKSLGEGISDIQKGFGSLPLVGRSERETAQTSSRTRSSRDKRVKSKTSKK
jgi:gas vesicle structural protein